MNDRESMRSRRMQGYLDALKDVDLEIEERRRQLEAGINPWPPEPQGLCRLLGKEADDDETLDHCDP